MEDNVTTNTEELNQSEENISTLEVTEENAEEVSGNKARKTWMDKIDYYVCRNKILLTKLSEQKVKVKKSEYSESIYEVYKVMDADNQNPWVVGKAKILEYANKVLLGEQPVPKKVEEAQEPVPCVEKCNCDKKQCTADIPEPSKELVIDKDKKRTEELISLSPRMAIYTMLLAAYELIKLDRLKNSDVIKAKMDDLLDYCASQRQK